MSAQNTSEGKPGLGGTIGLLILGLALGALLLFGVQSCVNNNRANPAVDTSQEAQEEAARLAAAAQAAAAAPATPAVAPAATTQPASAAASDLAVLPRAGCPRPPRAFECGIRGVDILSDIPTPEQACGLMNRAVDKICDAPPAERAALMRSTVPSPAGPIAYQAR